MRVSKGIYLTSDQSKPIIIKLPTRKLLSIMEEHNVLKCISTKYIELRSDLIIKTVKDPDDPDIYSYEVR